MGLEVQLTYALDNKRQLFEKELTTFITYFLIYKERVDRPRSFTIPSSSAGLSAAFSAPRAAVIHFMQKVFQNNKQ